MILAYRPILCYDTYEDADVYDDAEALRPYRLISFSYGRGGEPRRHFTTHLPVKMAWHESFRKGCLRRDKADERCDIRKTMARYVLINACLRYRITLQKKMERRWSAWRPLPTRHYAFIAWGR